MTRGRSRNGRPTSGSGARRSLTHGIPPRSALAHYSARYEDACAIPADGIDATPWALVLPPEVGQPGRKTLPASSLVVLHETLMQRSLFPKGTPPAVICEAVARTLGPGLSAERVRRMLRPILSPIRREAGGRNGVLDAYGWVLLRLQSIREQHPFPGGAPVVPIERLRTSLRGADVFDLAEARSSRSRQSDPLP